MISLALFTLASGLSSLSRADDSSTTPCGQVTVDCTKHKITMDGIDQMTGGGSCDDPSKVDCGSATKDGTGNVGGPHNGDIVPDGIEIDNIDGMGASGGGKVFHTPNPEDEASCPKGVDDSRGCIHTCKDVLEQLRSCKGAPLKIVGAGNGTTDEFSNPTAPNGAPAEQSTVTSILRNEVISRLIIHGLFTQCPAEASEIYKKADVFTMKAHQLVDIKSYDNATKTYSIVNLKYWGQGPLVTTPEELVRAIPALQLKRIQRHPASILHNQYQTDQVMVLMMPNLIEARRAKHRRQ